MLKGRDITKIITSDKKEIDIDMKCLKDTLLEIEIVDPPIAVTGENIVAAPGQSIQLDGSNSEDPAGGMLIYHWRQVGGPLVELVDFTQAEAGFEVPVDMENTILTFLLVVTNSNGISSKSYLSVTVNH